VSKYRQVALAAFLDAKNGTPPMDAWKASAAKSQPSSRDKGCPRCAFLGLAEGGLLQGIPSGAYTTSQENKRYALEAVRLLKRNPQLSKDIKKLWQLSVKGVPKKHNGQMDVVVALWDAKVI